MSERDTRIQAFVDPGLGNSSYLVAAPDRGVAAVIDPQRDVDQYLAAAKVLGVAIAQVIDTHLHADFVSGARELASQAGAGIAASAGAQLRFDHRPLRDGERLDVGGIEFRVLETPGHSPEHISLVLTAGGKPGALFSGGALMVGGAARTDLLGEADSVPLARKLYHTLQKIMTLPDEVQLLPTHGAGSFCAAPVSKDRTSTIGRERASNPLAQPMSEVEFVRRALSGLPSYPVYFSEMRSVNQVGPKVFQGLPQPPSWDAIRLRSWADGGGAVVDVRSAQEFAEGHVPGAYSIGTDVWVETWAGWLIPFGTPLALVADTAADLEDAVRQLFRIGYDDLQGQLAGGMAAWRAAGFPEEKVRSVTATELRRLLDTPEAPTVLDVRFDREWRRGHIPGAVHVENGDLARGDLPFPPERTVAVHCATGGRSMTGISVLARRGYRNLLQVSDGITGWQAAGLEVRKE